MSWQRVTLAGLIVFTALSVTDFFQTFALVETTGGRVVEGNPVAAEWLDRWGWAGLAAFKTGAVAVVLGVVFVLARHRPPAGALVAALGCIALIGVTTYSHDLLANPPGPVDEDDEVLVWHPPARSGPAVRSVMTVPPDRPAPLS